MRTELFSVRQSDEEIKLLSGSLRTIVSELDRKSSIRVLFKTEIDCNPRTIKSDLMSSLATDNPPELYLYVNALDTKDSSSFRKLFTPVIEKIEKNLPEGELAEDGKTRLYPNIKVYPITELEGDYPAYCFTIRNRKVIVLPRISLVGENLSDYLCKVVNCAKDIFSKAFTECPEGYVYLPRESKISRLKALFFKKKSSDNIPTKDTATEEALPDSNEALAEITACNDTVEIDSTCIPAVDSSDIPAMEQATEENNNVDSEEDVPEDTKDADSVQEDKTADKTKKGKFTAFIKSFIPMKGDGKKTIITKSVVLVAIAGFLVATGMLLNFYVIEPWINSKNMGDIQDIFYGGTVITDEEGNIIADGNTKNWAGLKEINNEIIGWIKLDNTKIDYPVLYHKGDSEKGQYYLYRNYKKQHSEFGSIFLDYRCEKGTASKNIILHGHNMGSDDSMFASLLNYTNVDFYKDSPIVNFDTPKGNEDWVVFAIMKIDVSYDKEAFNYLTAEFESNAQFMNFVYNIKEMSYLTVDIPINEDDQLLTLSTCSYERENTRTVVVARKLRDDENVNKYVRKAKTHSPVSKVTSSFSEQLEAGKIKWYDGDGKLTGKEDVDFLEPAEIYDVKFVDANGKVILISKVPEGGSAKPPEDNPRKASDGTYYYTFAGWDKDYTNVTKDMTVKPTFTKHKLNLPEPTTWATVEKETDTEPPATTQKPTQAPATNQPTNAPTNAPTDPIEEASQ